MSLAGVTNLIARFDASASAAPRTLARTTELLMPDKVHWGDLAVAVVAGTMLGVVVGLGAGFLAKAFGWPTNFVGAFTGALVGVLVSLFYQLRSRRRKI